MGGEGELFGERRAALWEGIVGYRIVGRNWYPHPHNVGSSGV